LAQKPRLNLCVTICYITIFVFIARRSPTNGEQLTTTYTYNDLDQLEVEYHDGPEEGVSMRLGSDTFYAYATQDGIRYKYTGEKDSIGGFKAFMMGLPTKASRPVLIGAWALLAVVALAPVLIQILSRLRRNGTLPAGSAAVDRFDADVKGTISPGDVCHRRILFAGSPMAA